ncbi:MAG: IS3 family transposase [Actinobacteria bacterium]|nr:IS3 family transposase [Actinomycetota bacterium]
MRDEGPQREIARVWGENFRVYGADKVWRQLNREDTRVARCAVERLMPQLGLCVRRAKRHRTTPPSPTRSRHVRPVWSSGHFARRHRTGCGSQT